MSGSEACGGPEPWRPRNPPSRMRPRSRPRRRRRTPPVPTRTAGASEADLGGDRGGRSGGGVREWPTLTGGYGCSVERFLGGSLVPRDPPVCRTASSFVKISRLSPYYRIRPTEAALGPFSRQPRRQGGLPRLGHGAAVAEASPRRSDATRTAAARLKSHIHASKCYFHPFCVAAAHESTRKRARVDRVIMGEPPLDGVTPQRPVRAGRPSRGPSPRPTRAPQTASSPPRRRGRTV